MSLELDDLLNRCEAFDEDFETLMSEMECADTPKAVLIVSMCELALEHGTSLRLLIAHGNLASAIALLRIQLDAIIRIAWIHYVAGDEWVQSVITAKPGMDGRDPTYSLSMKAMLQGIESKAPPELHRQLAEFQSVAWPALNSYVHSGIWPVVQRLGGDEVQGAIQTLRNSCGLTGMAGMVIAMYTGDPVNTSSVKLLQLRHKGCLPPLKEP